MHADGNLKSVHQNGYNHHFMEFNHIVPNIIIILLYNIINYNII